jgi:hypothetical protein
MNHTPSPLPIRTGDPVRTLPGSGDRLTGRVTAVYAGGAFYRVRFPQPSPYFFGDEGVVYRAHEIELATTPAVKPVSKLPKRPQPFTT